MAIEIKIPRLGWSMDEGIFAGWLKHDGEPIHAGDPLFSLEGEKATQDVEAIDEGTLSIPSNAPVAGEKVAVGTVVGYLLRAGESIPRREGQTSSEPNASPVRTVPRPPGIAKNHLSAKPTSSPLARRVAREHGIDWTQLRGSGITGRIRKVDVLEAVRARQSQVRPHSPHSVSPTRRIIAERMIESCRTTAPVTLSTTIDATHLVGLRRQFKAVEADGVTVPSFTDFVVKLSAIALRAHPLLKRAWEDGDAAIIVSEEANIGIAVDTEAGLLVPVIHRASELGIQEVALRSRDLIRVRPGAAATAGRYARRDVHRHQPGSLWRRDVQSDHQRARVRDSRDWQDRAPAGDGRGEGCWTRTNVPELNV